MPNTLNIMLIALATGFNAAALDANSIGDIIGAEATIAPDGVVRVTWGRTDVDVHVDGVPLKPFAGLTSWAAFKETHDGAMVMGDTVVFQDEANPAIDAAFAHGLEITALHNHFFFDDPPVYFMHIGGAGNAEDLARGVHAMWDAVKAVRAKSAEPAPAFAGEAPAVSTISSGPLQEILGVEPAESDGMVKFTFGREAAMHGMPFGASMGLTTWAAFTGNDESAMVGGDFAMTAEEVQPVLHALRKAGINIVALHNHMIGEAPAYYFVHFWGKGKPAELASGLASALQAQDAKR